MRRKPGYPLVSFAACGVKRIPLLSLARLGGALSGSYGSSFKFFRLFFVFLSAPIATQDIAWYYFNITKKTLPMWYCLPII
jgi:hypothetical protein